MLHWLPGSRNPFKNAHPFLDANIYFAGISSPSGASSLILEIARRGKIKISSSRLVLREAERNPKLKTRVTGTFAGTGRQTELRLNEGRYSTQKQKPSKGYSHFFMFQDKISDRKLTNYVSRRYPVPFEKQIKLIMRFFAESIQANRYF